MAKFTKVINIIFKSIIIDIKNYLIPRKSSKKELHQIIVKYSDFYKTFSFFLYSNWFFYIIFFISSVLFFAIFDFPVFRIILFISISISLLLELLSRYIYTIDKKMDHNDHDFFQKFYEFFENEKASTQKSEYYNEVLRLRLSAGNLIDFPNSFTLIIPTTIYIIFLGVGFAIIQKIWNIQEIKEFSTIVPIIILIINIIFESILLSLDRTKIFLKNLDISYKFINNYFVKSKNDIQVSINSIFKSKTISDTDLNKIEIKIEELSNLYFACTSNKDLTNKILQDFSKIVFNLEELYYWRELTSKVIGKATLQSDIDLDLSKIEKFRRFLESIIKSRESKISMNHMKRNSILAISSLIISGFLFLLNVIQFIIYKNN